jgi:hypothetical protein
MSVFADLVPTGSFRPAVESTGHEAETVTVTPCTSTGGTPRVLRDRIFASRCEFIWRSEIVYNPSGNRERPFAFKRYRQLARFDRIDLHDRLPATGDEITRAWDGATFTITATYRQNGCVLCEIAERPTRLN